MNWDEIATRTITALSVTVILAVAGFVGSRVSWLFKQTAKNERDLNEMFKKLREIEHGSTTKHRARKS